MTHLNEKAGVKAHRFKEGSKSILNQQITQSKKHRQRVVKGECVLHIKSLNLVRIRVSSVF